VSVRMVIETSKSFHVEMKITDTCTFSEDSNKILLPAT
jgi:hypothetical protein